MLWFFHKDVCSPQNTDSLQSYSTYTLVLNDALLVYLLAELCVSRNSEWSLLRMTSSTICCLDEAFIIVLSSFIVAIHFQFSTTLCINVNTCLGEWPSHSNKFLLFKTCCTSLWRFCWVSLTLWSSAFLTTRLNISRKDDFIHLWLLMMVYMTISCASLADKSFYLHNFYSCIFLSHWMYLFWFHLLHYYHTVGLFTLVPDWLFLLLFLVVLLMFSVWWVLIRLNMFVFFEVMLILVERFVFVGRDLANSVELESCLYYNIVL